MLFNNFFFLLYTKNYRTRQKELDAPSVLDLRLTFHGLVHIPRVCQSTKKIIVSLSPLSDFTRWTPMPCMPQPRLYISIHTHLFVRFQIKIKNRIKHPSVSRDSFERDVFFYQDDLLRHPSVPIIVQTIGICTTHDSYCITILLMETSLEAVGISR